jgi:plastocyanin
MAMTVIHQPSAIVLLGAAALAVILSGISAGAGERVKPKKTYTVTMEGMKFQPEVLTVVSGDTVVWVNKDLVAHTATAQDGSFDSKLIAPDKSWKLTVRTPGNFAYRCTYHPTMKGTLKVEK